MLLKHFWLLTLLTLVSCVRPLPQTSQYTQPDQDRDGIIDAKDQCPSEPEDLDGFYDEDGCPELDFDKDGIADVDDKCPNEAEDFDEYEDEDGCPEKNPRVKLGRATLTTVTVVFEPNKSQLSPEGIKTLSIAAENLLLHPARLMITGLALPTESSSKSGRDRLALKRANTVRDYLIKGGVDPAMLEVQGYAIDYPDETPSAEFIVCLPL